MRLLHFNALGKPVLTDFYGKTIPPYAILSHRWTDSEVLIENIRDGTYGTKEQGNRKLEFCAHKAAHDDLQYFWIDTCCINRWNNKERSNAINSMFEWYKRATRCYVFLLDVSVSATTEPVQRSDWEALLRRSEWFTRGWTLQELIAPVSVEFFSVEGHRIGDKASLSQLLHDITGIPLSALHNDPLDEFSISERRRWVDGRKTKEEEDIVYCLFGILGVSMPTAYGEGKESAVIRLQTELEEASDVPSIIPFAQNPRFVGREEQLAELEAKLFTNEQTTTTAIAIVGPGGTGKSQLALEIAHRMKRNSKSCSVFWMNATDKDSLYHSYARVAQKLNITGWDDAQVDMKKLAKRCVEDISTRQCLLIFDNIEKTALLSSELSTTEAPNPVADFLPQGKLCSILFTTTDSDTAQALAPQNLIEMRALTPDAALRMLQIRLARPLSTTEQEVAQCLLRELSYLPLAIIQAIACINASGMTLQEYRLQLDGFKGPALEDSDDSSKGELQESNRRDPIAATLYLSVSQLFHRHELAAQYLCVAACLDRKDISLDILEANPTRRREDAIRILDKYALIIRRPADSALDLHRPVHQALRNLLQREEKLEECIKVAIAKLLLVFPNGDYINRSKWRRLLPHTQSALSHIWTDVDEKNRLLLAERCATTLRIDRRYREAEKLQAQVVEARRLLGEEHLDTLRAMNDLSWTYKKQGRLIEAEELAVKAMHTARRIYSNEHPNALAITHNLALAHFTQGRYKEEERLQVQVLKANKKVYGKEHPDTLKTMSTLAGTYHCQGRWAEAEELEVQVMHASRRVLGNADYDTLVITHNLALTLSRQGRFKEAEELQLQVLQERKRELSDEHPDTLISMHNHAVTLHSTARCKEACALMEKCYQSSRKVLGEQHDFTQSSSAWLRHWREKRL